MSCALLVIEVPTGSGCHWRQRCRAPRAVGTVGRIDDELRRGHVRSGVVEMLPKRAAEAMITTIAISTPMLMAPSAEPDRAR